MNTWTRTQLKTKAKEVLKVNYWIALVVSLILGVVTGGGSGSSSNNYSNSSDNTFRETINQIDAETMQAITIGAIVLIGIVFFIIAISLLFKAFLGYQLEVGCQKFFVTSAEQPHRNMRPLGYCFSEGRYFPTMLSMLLKDVFIFLWTLLLIIPGIIKAFAYLMVPYILTDNAKIGAKRAIKLSREMMKGHKWRTFVLGLSFINWFIPGIILAIIGVIISIASAEMALIAIPLFVVAAIITGITAFFLAPYINSTYAQLYLILRDKAIEKNLITPEELNLKQTI